MDKTIIQKLKNSWRNCNTAAIGFANNVPSNQWSSKAFSSRFKSFSWEFACLARTRLCYLKGLKTGKLVFSSQADIPDKEILEKKPKREILKLLNETARDLLKEIEKIESACQIDFIIWLLQHERIHQGKLILYCAKANLKLPKPFVETWGKSNFPRH